MRHILVSNHKTRYFEIKKIKNKFRCNYNGCIKQFKVRNNLIIHSRTHTGEKPFKCDYQNCLKTFTTLGNLKSHESYHTGEKKYICNFSDCTKKFSRYFRLKIHLRTHEGLKPFKCPHQGCEKSFNEKGNLKTHFRIHTGEKPFPCTFKDCMKSFKTHGHLNDHLKRHENIKPFECKVCFLKFTRSSSLRNHSLIHSKEFICKIQGCGKIFEDKKSWVDHQKTHNKHDFSTEPNLTDIKESSEKEKIQNLKENLAPDFEFAPSKILNEEMSFPPSEVKSSKESDTQSNSNFVMPNQTPLNYILRKDAKELNFKKSRFNPKTDNIQSPNTISTINTFNQKSLVEISEKNDEVLANFIEKKKETNINFNFHNNNITFIECNEINTPTPVSCLSRNIQISNFSSYVNKGGFNKNIFNPSPFSPKDSLFQSGINIGHDCSPLSNLRSVASSSPGANLIQGFFYQRQVSDFTPFQKSLNNFRIQNNNYEKSNFQPSFSEMVNLTTNKESY